MYTLFYYQIKFDLIVMNNWCTLERFGDILQDIGKYDLFPEYDAWWDTLSLEYLFGAVFGIVNLVCIKGTACLRPETVAAFSLQICAKRLRYFINAD